MDVLERMTRARPAQAAPVQTANTETLSYRLDRATRLAKEPHAPVETPAARQARLLEQMERARPKP
jgi:hypothetical protein